MVLTVAPLFAFFRPEETPILHINRKQNLLGAERLFA